MRRTVVLVRRVFRTRPFFRVRFPRLLPVVLVFLQDKWVEQGLGRLTVNRFVTMIKPVFKHGSKYGWVNPATYHALLSVDNLKKG